MIRAPLPELPVCDALPALCAALSEAGCAVLAAPPGSGKTTLVPLALLEQPWLAGRRIVMLEPRRIAARAAAARMASLLGEKVGATVGYQVRFDRRVSAATRIEVLTEGLLTRRLQADPELPGVGLVIFDEFHERSLHADLAMALTLDARAHLNPGLRLLVMSATLDVARVALLLGQAPAIESGGRQFPVDIRYAPAAAAAEHGAAVAQGVLTALAETRGDVLAFLPGGREIRSAQRLLEARLGAAARVAPLYGDLPAAEQDAALRPAADGRRKVILATNIAQTSLTVEGVGAVVDGGLVRVARFDLGAGADRLVTQRVSRAAAEQRAGRAGRLGPGVAYRLWSRDQQAQLAPHDTPEILAADLSRFALELAAWGVADPAALKLPDAPPAAGWSYAADLLRALGATDAGGRITAHGRQLARLPAAPRAAHMLVAAGGLGLAAEAAWVAAVLDERESGTDLELAVTQFRAGRAEAAAQRRVEDTVRQLQRLVDLPAGARGAASAADGYCARLAALAFPERVARRRAVVPGQRETAYLCADGGEARLPAADPLAQSPWLAIAHWEPGTSRRVRLAAAIDEDALLRDQRERIVEADAVRWDAQGEAVVAERQRRLGAIVLSSRPLREGGAAVRQAMLDGVRSLGLQALPWSPQALQLQARVLSLRRWRPEEDWPDLSESALLAGLAEWLGPFLDGITRREQLGRLDLEAILEQRLEYAARQRLAKLAPTHVPVPSGSRIALEYSAEGAPPVLAVKLQELFGLTQTPTVNDGRTRVALHLLSPARRPIQVTQDLASFWARTYPEVRKELKGRYPRHPWPDDPLAAAPTARAKPRGGHR
ncbi:MAG: ATP-dependent helicase HrpB [Nevskia sp.]|nr:ATP-dependent helicase HrpB [Nevskia sp.]